MKPSQILPSLLLSILMILPALAASARRVSRFDDGWRFLQDEAPGAEHPGFDDASWDTVRLPHDWSIHGPWDENHPGGASFAFLPAGIGWYRKTFDHPAPDSDRRIVLRFDGIYENATVWINGVQVAEQGYGYTSFHVDLTPHLRGDAPNVLAVRVDNSHQPNSRWYTGSGICRHTWLTVTDPLHIAPWGVYVTTPEITDASATVRVQTTLRNDGDAARDFTLTTRIQDADGDTAHTAGTHRLGPGETVELTHDLTLPSPRRWSPDTPHLYTVRSEVRENDRGVDSVRTTFGVRTLAFDSEKGFLLNGRSVNLKGVNLHMDGGAVGTAVPVGVWERRLRTLKEMGANAIRIGHHPPAPEFLELCDRMGFLVINEAFDKWDVARYWRDVNRHFADHWEHDLVSMLRRDRNHPSIVLWSVGNENGLVWTEEFFERHQSLVEVVRREDPTRPVTAALRPIYPPEDNRTVEGMVEALAPMIEVLDVALLNYQEHLYEAIRARLPEVVILGGESYGYFRGRGMNHKSDDEYNPWFEVEKHGWVAGQFLWPGIDYLGESTGWPAKARGDSPIETTGFRKPRSYWHQSVWSGEPVIHIAVRDDSMEDYPQKHTWHWPAVRSDWTLGETAKGKIHEVHVYSNCDRVELYLNGVPLGRQRPAEHLNRTTVWQVPFEPGLLRAVGFRDGRVVAEHTLRTAGPPAALRLIPDKTTLERDGLDVVHVEVRVEDADGIPVPDAAVPLTFSVTGPAELIGLDNGDLRSEESYKGTTRRTWRGRCLAILQGIPGEGDVQLTVTAEGFAPVTLAIP